MHGIIGAKKDETVNHNTKHPFTPTCMYVSLLSHAKVPASICILSSANVTVCTQLPEMAPLPVQISGPAVYSKPKPLLQIGVRDNKAFFSLPL